MFATIAVAAFVAEAAAAAAELCLSYNAIAVSAYRQSNLVALLLAANVNLPLSVPLGGMREADRASPM